MRNCRFGSNCGPFGLGLDIVGATERHYQQRFFGRNCRRYKALIPLGQVNGIAQHCQLADAAAKINQAVALAVGAVQGDAVVFTVTQDRLDQAGQTGARADLHKAADTISVHGLYLGHEFNRTGQLIGQLLLDGSSVSRVGGCTAVGIDRHGGAAQLKISQGSQERCCCVSHQGAVEGCRNRQLFTDEFATFTGCLSQLDLIGCTGQHRLVRGVAVGDHQIDLLLCQHLLNRCQRC